MSAHAQTSGCRRRKFNAPTGSRIVGQIAGRRVVPDTITWPPEALSLTLSGRFRFGVGIVSGIVAVRLVSRDLAAHVERTTSGERRNGQQRQFGERRLRQSRRWRNHLRLPVFDIRSTEVGDRLRKVIAAEPLPGTDVWRAAARSRETRFRRANRWTLPRQTKLSRYTQPVGSLRSQILVQLSPTVAKRVPKSTQTTPQTTQTGSRVVNRCPARTGRSYPSYQLVPGYNTRTIIEENPRLLTTAGRRITTHVSVVFPVDLLVWPAGCAVYTEDSTGSCFVFQIDSVSHCGTVRHPDRRRSLSGQDCAERVGGDCEVGGRRGRAGCWRCCRDVVVVAWRHRKPAVVGDDLHLAPKQT